ncbi:MAG: right-handed parallel beta-helix repeat-containing protein [Coleofasciculus sp. G3-WIS-01]|uniref:beta strand repeat-containing protein n=1 Tax=Coleofasciculus sp. G3-WIS-01 TaxID=3069528 RepID=UPI0032F7AE01
MKISAQALCVGLLFSGGLTSPVIAQMPESEIDAPRLPTQGTATDLRVLPRIGGKFTTEGAGYQDPFFSLEGFVPITQNPGITLTFLEGQLRLLTDSTMGGTILLGQRFYNSSQNRILGGYLSYDTRDTGNSIFHQIGAGFERLGEDWDLRVNAYLPVGERRQKVDESFSLRGFGQNNLLINHRQHFEAAMAGFDIEAGGRLLQLGEGDLRGYAGVYYYGGEGTDNTIGIRGRLEAHPTDYLNLGLSVQTDQIFDTRIVLSLGATFPGTRPRGVEPASALARMGESVGRIATIIVDEQTENGQVAAINPKTGQPWQFQHVTLGMSTGNGTFETPFGTVQNALSVAGTNEIVYVQVGTTSEMEAFQLADGVVVLSAGSVQRIDTQQLGTVQLPLSGNGQFPTVMGTVTLGNNTTLTGFAIANVTGNGIQGANIENVTIQDNRIANATGQGISLIDVTGTSAIARNVITNTGQQGIFIQASETTQQELTLDSNQIRDSGAQGVFIQASGEVQQQLTATNNQISNSVGQGFYLAANNNSRQTFDVFNTSISNTVLDANGDGGQGLFLQANASAQQILTLDTLTVTESAGQGIFIAANGNGDDLTQQSVQDLNLSNAIVSESTGQGIFIAANNNSQQTFNIDASTINQTRLDSNGDGGQGVFIQGNRVAVQDFTLNSTTVTNSAGQGILIATNGDEKDLTAQSIQEFQLNNTQVSDTVGQGIFIAANNNSEQVFNLDSSTIRNVGLDAQGEGGQGIFVQGNRLAVQEFQINSPTITNNAGQGIFVATNGDANDLSVQSRQEFGITDAQITDSTGQGIFMSANNNGSQNFEIKDSTIDGTKLNALDSGGQAVFVQANSIAQQDFTIDNVQISDSQGQGIFVAANGDEENLEQQSQQRFQISNVQISNSTGQGIFVSANNNSRQEFDIETSTIRGTIPTSGTDGGQGIFVQGNAVAVQDYRINNTTITDNVGQGIFLQTNGNAQTIADFELTILDKNAIPGFNAVLNSDRTFCLALTENTSTTEFQLQRNDGTFKVVNLDNLPQNNTGTINFAPSQEDFTPVPQCN